MSNTILTPQLKPDAKYLAQSLVLIQLAVIMNVVLPILLALASHPIYLTLGLKGLHYVLFIQSIVPPLVCGLLLAGVFRIAYLLRSEVHVIVSIIAIGVFVFFFGSASLNLWHHILIVSGYSYSPSEWKVIGLLISPPLGIVSCCVIAAHVKRHFSHLRQRRIAIHWFAITFGLIWLLAIIIAYIQWWQNKDTIEFSLRWLVMRNHRWQQQGVFPYLYLALYYIPLCLWQVWLFIDLRTARRRLFPALKE